MSFNRTIPGLLRIAINEASDRVFLRVVDAKDPQKEVTSWTYKDFGRQIQKAIRGLQELGVGASSRILILADNSPEWQVMALAGQCLRAEVVGLFATLGAMEVANIVPRVQPEIIVISSEEQLAKVLPLLSQIKQLKAVITLDESVTAFPACEYRSYGSLIAGDPVSEQEFSQLVDAVAPEDLFIMIFTSGTTGQFIADVVMPKDLREFFLPDFSEVRIPIWAIDLQYFFSEESSLELVLSPDRSVHKIALQEADFAFRIEVPTGIDLVLLDDNRPKTNFKDWNGGLRLVSFIGGWDFSWFYYTSADHIPALFKTIGINPSTGATELTMEPRHERIHHIGTTFSKGIEPVILRGEFVYTLRRLFNAEDVTVNDGLTRGNHFRYVIGLDYPIGGQVDMNAEFQQELIVRPNARVSDPRVRSWLFFHFSTGFMDEMIRPELTFIVGLNGGDTLVSPRLHYEVTDALRLTWGADIFSGPNDGLYGEFDQSDRIFMNTRFVF